MFGYAVAIQQLWVLKICLNLKIRDMTYRNKDFAELKTIYTNFLS